MSEKETGNIREVVAYALRAYGYSPRVVDALIEDLVEHHVVDAAPAERCNSTKAYRGDMGVGVVVRCNGTLGHPGDHDAGNGYMWGPDSGIKPETTISYAVEHLGLYTGTWDTMQGGFSSPEEADAKVDRLVDNDGAYSYRLRIVRVTETREVVE